MAKKHNLVMVENLVHVSPNPDLTGKLQAVKIRNTFGSLITKIQSELEPKLFSNSFHQV
jgi:hypothetical protein